MRPTGLQTAHRPNQIGIADPMLTHESGFIAKLLQKMERETGIEPATSSLGSWRSTSPEFISLSNSAGCQ